MRGAPVGGAYVFVYTHTLSAERREWILSEKEVVPCKDIEKDIFASAPEGD